MGKHLEQTPVTETGRQRRTPLWLRRAALVVGLVLIGFGSALAGFSIFKHQSPMQLLAQTFVKTPDQVFGKPNLLVLVEGLDYDYTNNDIEFSSQSRSDLIKVVNLQFQPKDIYVVSVLRDMLATYPDGSQRKINQAQADGGTKEAQQVIASFLGLPGFDRYVVLRNDATKDLINAIGGIDVYVKTSDCLQNHTGCTGGRIDYDDNWGHLHIHLTEGMHHLNGAQAVGYGRFRHDWCSDPCRSKRQDQVIMAAIDKLRGDKLNTLMHAGDLLNVVHRDIQTNLTNDELFSLASYFAGVQLSDVHFAQIPYTGDVVLSDGDDLIPDKDKLAQIVQDNLVAPPTPQPSPDAMALAAISPSAVKVDVKNASGMTGAAKAVADSLRKAGFAIADVGNADRSDEAKTRIEEHSNLTFAGAKVRSALPLPLQTTPISGAPVSTSSDVTIYVGRDLATAVVAKRASPSASPL
ncbi:MAG TPA: LCP family protein [Candidatus Aquilonibacter sp.]|nr:LCP family protein [Candidatus Aquilonibacter sp.]